jgi:hypothetical protein
MNLEIFKNSAALSRAALIARKYSPEILTAIGITGMIGTTVLASKATLKLDPVVSKIREQRFWVDEVTENELVETGTYDKQARTKAIAKVYIHGAVDLSKLYGPSFTLGVSSVACILAAHGIMRRRSVALTAAYKALETAFAEYRERIVSEIGEKKEEDARAGKQQVEVVDDEGKTKKVTAFNPKNISPYAKFFDEHNDNWTKTPEYNLLFLKAQQNYANDLLQSRGHVFLNDVYDMLGIPRTQAGQVVGWVVSKTGDNFVDFGLYDHWNDGAHLFVNGLETSILLDFNVDGVIYDLI